MNTGANGDGTWTRRRFLTVGGVSLVGFVAGCSSDDTASVPVEPPATVPPTTATSTTGDATLSTTPSSTSEATTSTTIEQIADCRVTPAFQEGPFYLDTGDVRRDVTENLAGAPFTIRLTLVDAATCERLAGLPVDIWSAAPSGAYSGVDNGLVVRNAPNLEDSSSFLRGRQIADDNGVVEFLTLYPGWYPVTAPHIHFTAPFDDGRSFTWQIFLDDDFSDALYTSVSPYDERGVHAVRTGDGGGRAPADAIVVPSGPASSPSLDLVIGIELAALTARPDVYDA